MTIYEPQPRHRCSPPVYGQGLLAANPTDGKGHFVPYGTLWRCGAPRCSRFFIARKYAPLLPGWVRVPAWWAQRRLARSKK